MIPVHRLAAREYLVAEEHEAHEIDVVRVRGGALLRALRDGDFLMGAASRLRFVEKAGGAPTGARIFSSDGDTLSWTFAAPGRWQPTPVQLQEFVGTWHQSEIDATWTARVEKNALVLELRPGTQLTLIAAYPDAFEAGAYGTVWFTRDKKGKVSGLNLGSGRVWELSFAPLTASTAARRPPSP